MAQVNGVVEWSGKDKFDNFSIKVNNNWYKSKYPIKAEKGDTVEFDDGGKNYANKLRVVTGGGTGTGSGTPSKGNGTFVSKQFPVPGLHPDRSIIRQNCLRHATELVTHGYHDGMLHSDNNDTVARCVIDLARRLEAYATGELDKKVAEEEVSKMMANG